MTVLTRLLGGRSESRDTEDSTTQEWLTELYAPGGRSFVRLNFVASLNGSVVGEDGTSESLTGGADRSILRVIRAHADVVLVGARTVRREGFAPPKHARLAVVTRSGDLTGAQLRGAPTPPLVISPAGATERVSEQLGRTPYEAVTIADGSMDATEIVGALTERGLSSIVCEGGPTLAAELVDAGLVDELCLTTSPQLRAPGVPLFPRLAETVDARLAHLLGDDDGYLYARWALSSRA